MTPPHTSAVDHAGMLEQALQMLFDAKREADTFRISSAGRAIEFHEHMRRMSTPAGLSTLSTSAETGTPKGRN